MSRALLALDLGTTTLAGRLVDESGRTLAEGRLENPQRVLGGDVIRRLEAALGGEGEHLQTLLRDGIAELAARLLASAQLPRTAIAAAAAAANPAITHLFARQPVEKILFPPHRPRWSAGEALPAAELGLDLPVPLYLFPLVSGYVGGDLVAFLFGAEHRPGTFYLDVGTNGEMAYFSGERWWTTSVAAGPAFEGGGISCGMAVAEGAVTGAQVVGDALRLQVVGGGAPRGVCGSGLAALVAAALKGGLLDTHGTFIEPARVATNLARYLVETPAGVALRFYRDARTELLLTQEDVRSFQLAKGALKAGAECLLARAGATAAMTAAVVTGAFGFSLAPAILKRVAMLPANMVDNVRFAPGGALAGVCRFLLDSAGPARVAALAGQLQPLPLSGTPVFEKAFLNALDF